ncbi:tRNA (adenine(22)-N(1))-methyltransferase [Anaerostipes sp.]|uniref:tRNA (adenine(22)-N(1))-methyltransferase n=1 Tax=Anaerostipes sp. TaxID=1872530 RepID=UPI0025C492CA|nr:class I SAM-dependent methyltransferase [Anaerostipes sp.]MBS7008356.1 SAM-dependent methyltransferase [Anaerostipes sp.]
MELSIRLKTIASFVSEGMYVADIGTDHGYIPIYLTSSGISDRAYAMDVNRGPLERARQNIKKEGLDGQIECILSDGMGALPDDADSAVIAGMGGDLMEQILIRGEDKLGSVAELVLSPQSHWEKVRKFLHRHGFAIEKEALVKEDGKYYIVIKAVKGREAYQFPWQYTYGNCLPSSKDPCMKEYLLKEKEDIQKILISFHGKDSETLRCRAEELSHALEEIEEALKNYEMQ